MRFPKRKVAPRATVIALALGVVGVLLTAVPAWAAAPVTQSFAPPSGPPGTVVTVTGTGFQSATGLIVRFNGLGGTASSNTVVSSDTSLTAVVPCGAGDGPINVFNADGNDNSPTSFDVTAATAPTITSFLPASGPVGTSVVITGTNFCGATQVLFNATPALNVTINSPTSITAVVPVGATTGLIRVTTPVAPPANSATSFVVAAAPTITSFTPTSGPVGTSVVITGTNLTGTSAVRFNGLAATFSAVTATSVTAVVPTGATTGKVSLTTPGGIATSTADFTVTTAPIPRVVTFGFEPNSRVSGQVNVSSGLAACRSLVPVVIQKQKSGSWKWVDTTATRKSGSYKTYIPPSNGNFRAKINQITLANGVVCAGSTSNVVHS